VSSAADNLVRQMQKDEIKALEADQVPEDESIQDEKWSHLRLLSEKIKPEWKQADRYALEQLKAAAQEVTAELYDEALDLLDKFYASVRIPQRGVAGHILKDYDGRPIWTVDEFGQPKEDWSNISSEEIDKTLIKLQETEFTTKLRVKELFLEAVFAKKSLEDEWHETFEQSVEGTTPIREARANRQTKDAKWMYFYRYYIWSMADTFENEINKTMDLLKRIRDWRSKNRHEGGGLDR
jgi:hypothetical protein